MSKQFNLDIDKYQAEIYIKSVRSKHDIVLLWMATIKNFLVGQPASGQNGVANLSIHVEKMSRLFCTSKEGAKIFSVAFPFSVMCIDDEYRFFSREGIEIDSRVSSSIISVITSGEIFVSQDFSKFIDPILEMSEFEPSLWALVRELMLAEDCYVRYDWDKDGRNGHVHPEHHLDFFYSNEGTFKVGLEQQIDKGFLASILDSTTDCHYLKTAT